MCRAWRKVTMVPFISVPPEAASIGSTEKKEQFTACTDIDADYCYNMDITTKGYLAISNDHGLLIYHPQTKEKQLIDVESLHLSAINEGCGLLICRNGETFVGGIEGMSSFMNSSLQKIAPNYNLYFFFFSSKQSGYLRRNGRWYSEKCFYPLSDK